ncbi:MAG: response regulator [Lachnospiraceae bacterium]|nr:response regulator [Lachnospiraceae bacterium]
MYRVMLIDDEPSVRKLLSVTLDWKSMDMEIVGEASSGIEAINIIDDLRPDIAIVDISMPFMNGIEFTEVATKRYPELKIIILTAFDDFEYARKCVSLPVFDYMLKPVVRTEVTETLKKLKAVLDERVKEEPEEDPVYDDTDSSIEQIKRYIETNYTDSKINLTSVAQTFGFSTSYLSRKFKQETGKNFVEYLTECRMEKAMELAKAHVKMFCASGDVGIPDPNYFGRCFKKYTGMSYSDYSSSNR